MSVDPSRILAGEITVDGDKWTLMQRREFEVAFGFRDHRLVSGIPTPVFTRAHPCLAVVRRHCSGWDRMYRI
jgi:hypothetical protein